MSTEPSSETDESRPEETAPADSSATSRAADALSRRAFRHYLLPFGTLFLSGAIVFGLALATVHRRTPQELLAHPMAQRTHFTIAYWLNHGFFCSAGAVARTSATTPLYFHRSSTSARFVSTFVVEKIYASITGRYSWRLAALHNQIIALLAATLLGLLVYRLASRWGATRLHAAILGSCTQVAHFTFPDNLALYWGTTGREWFVAFAALFLLFEERNVDRPTRWFLFAQALAAFALTCTLFVEGAAFLLTYCAIKALLNGRSAAKRILAVCVVPALLAAGLFMVQRSITSFAQPNVPSVGSSFLFRTGLDGSTQYYGDHLDIAFGRDVVRAQFQHNKNQLFRWPWLFYAGVAATLITLSTAAYGRIPQPVTVSIVAFLGAYLLCGALFSQSVMIHPYLYDVILFTPLLLALLLALPMLLALSVRERGIIMIAVLLLTVCIAMAQLRRYAMQYPLDSSIISDTTIE